MCPSFNTINKIIEKKINGKKNYGKKSLVIDKKIKKKGEWKSRVLLQDGRPRKSKALWTRV